MKINPNQTRGLDRIVDRKLGSGTSLFSDGLAIILSPGPKDQIQLSQIGSRLQILVNDSEKFQLTERESKNFEIRGDQKNISFDPSVTLISKLPNQAPATEPELPAASSSQLGHARRMEGAFETAVTRKVITDELKEDAFVNHIGKQMFRFLEAAGVPPGPPMVYHTEKELLPLLEQFQSIPQQSSTLPKNFIQELNRTIQNVQQQIQNGASIDVGMLGAQLSQGLKQLSPSKAGSSSELPSFEAHQIPFGIPQRAAFQNWRSIQAAIVDQDPQSIRQLSNDPAFMRFALPEEKGAFIRILAGQVANSQLPQAEKIFHAQGMISWVQSSQSLHEFKTMMEVVGFPQIQQALQEVSKMPGNLSPAVSFDVVAHLFQAPEFALNKAVPPFLSDPFVQAFTPQQILAGRREITMTPGSPWPKEVVNKFSENPLILAISTPLEKGAMIQTLQSGYVSLQDEHAVLNILQSAMNASEFQQIVAAAGGKQVGAALQDPAARIQWNHLAGAYELMDLTTDFVEGLKTSAALLEPFQFGFKEIPPPQPFQTPSFVRDMRIQDVAVAIDTFLRDVPKWIANQVSALDRGAYVGTGLLNLNRALEGLPVLNFAGHRQHLQTILTSPAFQPAQIFDHLKNLAATTGLGVQELRSLITQPLAFIYSTTGAEAAHVARELTGFLQENIERSAFLFGPQASQTKLIQRQAETIQQAFLPFVQHLQTVSKLLSEAFPPPPDLIVGLSQFASAFKNNFAPLLNHVLPQLTPTIHQLFANVPATTPEPPLAASSSIAPQIVSQLSDLIRGADLIRSDSAKKFSEMSQQLARLPETSSDLVQFTKQAGQFFSTVQDGSYAKVLNEIATNLNKYNDPIAELARTTAQEGMYFLTQLQNGTLTKTFSDFAQQIQNLPNDPAIAPLTKSMEQMASITGQLLAPPKPDMASAPNRFAEEASDLISELAGGGLRGAFRNVGAATVRFRESPFFRNVIELMEKGGRFLTALRSGSMAQTLDLLQGRFGYSPAIAQLIERGMHLSTNGSFVVKALIGRDFERPLLQLTRKSQAKTEAAKELADAQSIFSSASTFFYALSDVQNMDLLWQYHRQLGLLKDEVLIDSTIREFEKQAQALAADPDLRKSLANQLNSFQKNRPRPS